MVKKIKSNLNGTAEYLCDTLDDVVKLPKANTGSLAIVISTADVYVVNTQKQWKKFGGDKNES